MARPVSVRKLGLPAEAASSNPLLADVLRSFDSDQPIWDRQRDPLNA